MFMCFDFNIFTEKIYISLKIYTLEHYKPDAQRASGSVFNGNVTGKSIVSGAHQRWASGFKCSPV